MLTEAEVLDALRRHWAHSGKDEDIAHEIYHEDAAWSFLSPESDSKVSKTSVNGGGSTQRRSSSTSDESTSARTSVVTQYLISYNGAPWMHTPASCNSETTKYPRCSGSTSWMVGSPLIGRQPWRSERPADPSPPSP